MLLFFQKSGRVFVALSRRPSGQELVAGMWGLVMLFCLQPPSCTGQGWHKTRALEEGERRC